MPRYQDVEDEEEGIDTVDTTRAARSPARAPPPIAQAALPAASSPTIGAAPVEVPRSPLVLLLLGGLIGVLLATTALTQIGLATTQPATPGGGWGSMAGARDALSFAIYGGPLAPSATSSAGPRSASGTGTPTTTLSAGATASGTPSAPPTPSGTPSGSNTPSSSPTGSDSQTPSGTPSGTRTGTGTPTGTPTIPAGMSFSECEIATRAYLARLRERGRATQDDGQPSPVRIMPLTHDVLMGAVWETCPDAAATDATWRLRVEPDDVCYVVRDLSNNADARAATLSTWGSQVKNLFIMTESPDDAAQKTIHVEDFVGKPSTRHALVLVKAANGISTVRDCKFVVTTSNNAWTNPRIVLASLQGVSPNWPVALAFFWNDMGFVDLVTCPAQGFAVWSASAWKALADSISSGACIPNTMKTDDVLVGACAIAAGVIPVNVNNVDSSGALVLNGVPLEPGPPGEQISWLQQPHNRAGHWMHIEGTPPALIRSLWNDYISTYQPWGKLVGSAPSASPSPPTVPTSFKTYAGGAPCAARATIKLRAALDASRTSPTVAIPLTVDVAAEITATECNPRVAPGSADPPPSPGSFAHTVDHNICAAITYSGAPKVVKFVSRGGWGWRMRHKEGDKHRRLWIFGSVTAPELNVYTIPGFADGDANDAANRILTIVKYLAALDPASVDHCEWWYIGGTDIDWVNPRALANTVRDLHADSPVAVGLWLHRGSDVDVPATGRMLLSRAALAALGADALTPACPRSSNDFAVEAARCLAKVGGVPVHSYALDVAGMAVGMDWAFQQEMYLMGWGMNVNMGLFFSPTPTNDYPWRMGLLEMYYSHLFGALWNVTAPDFYVTGDLGDHAAGDGGIGDRTDGSIVEGDGDGWRRLNGALAFETEFQAERDRVDFAGRAAPA